MSDDNQNNARMGAMQAAYANQARAQAAMQQAAQGACRGIGYLLNQEVVAQQPRLSPETVETAKSHVQEVLDEGARRENEACAVLAESLGFPELARHIRMRVSTSAKEKP